jgi:hypothetical protein
MVPSQSVRIPENRRQHPRFLLGLPVKLHLEGRGPPLTVEVVDVSVGGARLRAYDCQPRLNQRATLRFLLPDQRTCVAHGHVDRVGHDPRRTQEVIPGMVDFVLRLDDSNEAFHGFLASLED